MRILPGEVRLCEPTSAGAAARRPLAGGLAPDGLAPDGLAPDGLAPDGLAPDGLAPDGLGGGAV